MAGRRKEYVQNMIDLDSIISELEKIRDGIGVLDYTSFKPDAKDDSKDKDFLKIRDADKAKVA